MFGPSHNTDSVTDFYVLSLSFGLCYSWEICVSIHKYGINRDNISHQDISLSDRNLINPLWEKLVGEADSQKIPHQ